jgi:hypothetical protein
VFFRVAEDAGKKSSLSFSKAFPFLSQFFENGTMERERGKRQSKGKAALKSGRDSMESVGSPPQLVLPFIDEILEAQVHNNESVYLSQIQVQATRSAKPVYHFREVYITGVHEKFEVKYLE